MSGSATVGKPRVFSVGGESHRGPRHEKLGLPNQDAILWKQPVGGELPIVLALSDGHGSTAYFRSDVGAQLAVEVAVEEGLGLAEDGKDAEALSTVKRLAEERLPQQISRRWTERVQEHLQNHPITAEEREQLANATPFGLDRLARNETNAYGATLLTVIVTARFIVFVQLGDGDLIWVEDSGESRILFEAPPEEVGEDTYSLCMKDAWQYFKVKVAPTQDGHPPLLLASTDGYSKSYVNDSEFRRIGADYLELIRRSGLGALRDELPGFLESTNTGSGDDITLGFIRASEPHDFDSTHREEIGHLEKEIAKKVDREDLETLTAEIKSVRTQIQAESSIRQTQVGALTSRIETCEGLSDTLKAACLCVLLILGLAGSFALALRIVN